MSYNKADDILDSIVYGLTIGSGITIVRALLLYASNAQLFSIAGFIASIYIYVKKRKGEQK